MKRLEIVHIENVYIFYTEVADHGIISIQFT